MTRAAMDALLTGFVVASLLGPSGCAGSAPKATAPAMAGAPAAPAAPGSTRAPTSPSPAAPTSPAAASATPAAGSTAAVASSAPTPAGQAGAVPVASGAAATAEPGAAAAGSAAAAEPATSGPLAKPPVAVTPPPASAAPPRVLLADELPYIPGHLRAHDAKAERRHPRDREPRDREGAGTRGNSRTAEALPEHDRSSKRAYHPAPGIVVDVIAAEGGGSAPDLQRAARNLGYWPFRQCYEEGLRRDPRLAGKVSLELAINPSGEVDRSVVTTTSEHDAIVAACVAREAQHLALPASGSPTTAKVDVSLAVGDEPVPAGRPIPNAEPVREALRASWNAVRQCYSAALASHPGVGGRMELHFRVRHGDVEKVDETGGAGEGGRFGDVDVTRCVLGIYRTARLPAHGVHDRSFVYALQFESTPVDGGAP